jgi:transcriptional regulator with XRE-family HTH domain
MLRQERRKRKWTQEFVAKQVGITNQAVNLLETGLRRPSYDVLVKLLDLFGYDDPRKLFGAATPERQKEPDGNPAEPNL